MFFDFDNINTHAVVIFDALNTGNPSVAFTGGGPAVLLDSGLTLANPGGLTVPVAGTVAPGLTGATVTISSGFEAGDILSFNGTADTETFADGYTITGAYAAATGILTLSGTATAADYQTALRQAQYSFNPANGDPTLGGGATGRGITWTVSDGVHPIAGPFNRNVLPGDRIQTPGTTSLAVLHAAPVVNAGAPDVAYPSAIVDATGATTLDSGLTLSAPDSSGKLARATVSIGAGFLLGDTLSVFSNPGNLQVDYDAEHGVLTLTGVSSVDNYRAALDSVGYTSTLTDPSDGGRDTSRSINWQVDDGVAVSATATTSLIVQHVVTFTVNDDAALAVYGSTTSVAAVPGGVLSNDTTFITPSTLAVTGFSGAGGSATAGGAVVGAFGTLTLNSDGSYTYVEDHDAIGHQVDAFTYTASDGVSTGTAVLTLTLDHAPVVPDVSQALAPGASIAAGNLPFGSFVDPDGDGIGYVAVNGAAISFTDPNLVFSGQYGDLNIDGLGQYFYFPGATEAEQAALAAAPAGSHPTDAFIVTLRDDPGATATTTLSFVFDRAPTAAADTALAVLGRPLSAGAANGVLQNDSDADGDALTVTSVAGLNGAGAAGSAIAGRYGTLTLAADGSYSYAVDPGPAPAGGSVDTFTYAVDDGHEGSATAVLSISLDNPPVVPDATTSGAGRRPGSGADRRHRCGRRRHHACGRQWRQRARARHFRGARTVRRSDDRCLRQFRIPDRPDRRPDGGARCHPGQPSGRRLHLHGAGRPGRDRDRDAEH